MSLMSVNRIPITADANLPLQKGGERTLLKLKTLLDTKGVTAYRMAADLGFPQSTVSEWLSGAYTPKADKLLLIARYFGVPVEELIDDQEKNE